MGVDQRTGVSNVATADRLPERGTSQTPLIQDAEQLLGEFQRVGRAVADGRWDDLVDVAQFEGTDRELAEALNAALGSVIEPARAATGHLVRMAQEDDTAALQVSAAGEALALQEAVNGCAAAAQAWIERSEKVAEYQSAQVQEIAVALSGLANGDLDFHIELEEPDEDTQDAHAILSMLAEVVDMSAGAIRKLAADVRPLIDAALSGRLHARIDAAAHSGAYADIAVGINDTLDSVVGAFDAIPAPVQFMDGDFVVQYINRAGSELLGAPPDELVGKTCHEVWGTAKCLTAGCPCAMSMQSGEVSVTDNAVTIGDRALDLSCAAAPLRDSSGQVVGAFEFVTDQTEVTAAARKSEKIAEYQAAQTQELAVALGRLAQGDLDVAVDLEEGDADTAEVYQVFTMIAEAVSASAQAVGALAGDANRLAEAAVAGELGFRADASRHCGSFREVVEGLNRVLDAVSRPFEEAAQVLGNLAARDLTARMTGDYQGDYGQIKGALNSASEQLDQGFSQVAAAAEQVAAAAAEINGSSQAVAEGASEQASSLEEISSSLEQMASMTRQNAGNAHEAKGLSDAARVSADKGLTSMQKLSEAMDKIKASSDQTAKIVKTIDEIAFQTNLLALNAAVEAARAGDAGRGFAVVAEEVRNLAMRSADAAKTTADLIQGSVRNAEDGVATNTEVRANLNEIADQINKVSQVMDEIAAASGQQSEGIDQINLAVGQLDQVTQQNAANSESSASAAEQLAAQSAELQSTVAGFELSASEPVAPGPQPRPPVATPRRGTSAPPADTTPRRAVATRASNAPASAGVIPFDDDDDGILDDDTVLQRF